MNNTIKFTRGDSYSFSVLLFGTDGNPMNYPAGSTLLFSVKSSVLSSNYKLQKIITEFDGNAANIRIEAEDTDTLSYGSYRFDVELRYDDAIKTIVTDSELVLTSEVTTRG